MASQNIFNISPITQDFHVRTENYSVTNPLFTGNNFFTQVQQQTAWVIYTQGAFLTDPRKNNNNNFKIYL